MISTKEKTHFILIIEIKDFINIKTWKVQLLSTKGYMSKFFIISTVIQYTKQWYEYNILRHNLE
jgi:hypothetical protein